MHKWFISMLFLLLGQAEGSTGVSCLLKTQVIAMTEQPFMQEIAQLRVLEVRDDLQERNDFPCTEQFTKGMVLLVDVSRPLMFLAHRYVPGDMLPLSFRYADDRSGKMFRSYTVITQDEFDKRQAR